MGCWANEGYLFDASRRAVLWSERFAEASYAGPLHAVVADWNLDDANIEACLAGDLAVEDRALCKVLLMMTPAERWATALQADDPDFDAAAWREKLRE